MKKIISLFLACLVIISSLLVLVGCPGKKNKELTTSIPTPSQGITNGTGDNGSNTNTNNNTTVQPEDTIKDTDTGTSSDDNLSFEGEKPLD